MTIPVLPTHILRRADSISNNVVLALSRVCELVGKHCPGLLAAELLLARTHYLDGKAELAHRKALDVLRSNPDESDAHLLISNILLHQVSCCKPDLVRGDIGFDTRLDITAGLGCVWETFPALIQSKTLHKPCISSLQEQCNFSPEHQSSSGVDRAQGKPAAAMAALEAAVSTNFGVRESPQYAIVRAKVALLEGRLDEAQRFLDSAMGLPGIRRALSSNARSVTEPYSID